eukprot:366573-Chlamydomonas_euryale.AAC.9
MRVRRTKGGGASASGGAATGRGDVQERCSPFELWADGMRPCPSTLPEETYRRRAIRAAPRHRKRRVGDVGRDQLLDLASHGRARGCRSRRAPHAMREHDMHARRSSLSAWEAGSAGVPSPQLLNYMGPRPVAACRRCRPHLPAPVPMRRSPWRLTAACRARTRRRAVEARCAGVPRQGAGDRDSRTCRRWWSQGRATQYKRAGLATTGELSSKFSRARRPVDKADSAARACVLRRRLGLKQRRLGTLA